MQRRRPSFPDIGFVLAISCLHDVERKLRAYLQLSMRDLRVHSAEQALYYSASRVPELTRNISRCSCLVRLLIHG